MTASDIIALFKGGLITEEEARKAIAKLIPGVTP